MIYLDNASTSYPKPLVILEGMKKYLLDIGVNPLRGSSEAHRAAELLIRNTRQAIADLFHIKSSDNISFTHNATHALNIAIKGILGPMDHVIISDAEHNSVIRPLRTLESTIGVKIDVLKSNKNGEIQISNLENLIRGNTKLIAVTHASNVTGTILPIKTIGQIARKKNIVFLVDCAQTAGLIDINVDLYNIDILAGTGHKSLLGPSGIGFLYIKDYSLVNTLYEGGGGYDSFSSDHPHHMPAKYEAGTMNYLGIAGLKSSLEYLNSKKRLIYELEMKLMVFLTGLLKELDRVQLYGTSDLENKVPIISFNIDGLFPSQVAQILEKEKKIIVRSGLHCAPLMHNSLDTLPVGTVRVSFGHKNTLEEVELFFKIIKKLVINY